MLPPNFLVLTLICMIATLTTVPAAVHDKCKLKVSDKTWLTDGITAMECVHFCLTKAPCIAEYGNCTRVRVDIGIWPSRFKFHTSTANEEPHKEQTEWTSCKDVDGPDGEYDLYPTSTGHKKVKIYCHDVRGKSTEYITLPHVTRNMNITFLCRNRYGGRRGHGHGHGHHGHGHHGHFRGRHHGRRRRAAYRGHGHKNHHKFECGPKLRPVIFSDPPTTDNPKIKIYTTDYHKMRIDLERLELDLTDSTFIETFPNTQDNTSAHVGGHFGTFGVICEHQCYKSPPTAIKIALYGTSFKFDDEALWEKTKNDKMVSKCLEDQVWVYEKYGCGTVEMISPIQLKRNDEWEDAKEEEDYNNYA